jgi:hypothetical protein
MFPANAYRIHLATADDSDAVKWLAEQGACQPLDGRVLVGHLDGSPAAALSLLDGRVIADPSRKTDRLVATLRMRASAIRAYEATPSLRDRLRAALAAYRGDAIVVPASVWRDGYVDDERERWAA